MSLFELRCLKICLILIKKKIEYNNNNTNRIDRDKLISILYAFLRSFLI